jgi:Low molecular weight phosphotyrosine protein phosphatase
VSGILRTSLVLDEAGLLPVPDRPGLGIEIDLEAVRACGRGAEDFGWVGDRGGGHRGMATILFICTGNIFRSLTAEYALRAQLPPSHPHRVRSAGIEAHPEPVAPTVRDRLLARGVDCRDHVPAAADARDAGRGRPRRSDGPGPPRVHPTGVLARGPLFDEICFRREEGVLDLHEALADWSGDPEASQRYIVRTVDHIWKAMPAFIARLSDLVR